jgi:hypothetical protein
MHRGAVIVACVVIATSALAQPAPPQPAPVPVDPYPAPAQPAPVPFKGTVKDLDDPANKHPAVVARRAAEYVPWTEPALRAAFGVGISGTVIEHTNLYETTIGVESTGLTRVNTWTAFGLHLHIALRNWARINQFYSDMVNDKAHEGAEAYGFLFGWLAGTGVLAIGPEVMLGRARESRGWVSFGTSFFLFIDTNDDKLKDGVVLGHGVKFAAGLDISRDVGIGMLVRWAPSDGATIFGTNGPSFLSTMATIEVRYDDKKTKKKR